MKTKLLIISTLLILIANTTFGMYKQFNDRSMWYYNSPTPSAMLLISGNGNVGIGTSAPATKLEVAGTVSANAFVGDGAGLTNLPTVTTSNYAITASVMNSQGLKGTITVLSSGNVGIGTVSPVVALDVNGGIKIGSVNDCTAEKAGTIRWSGQHFEGCTGTVWRQFDNPIPPLIGSIIPAYGSKLGSMVITINGTGFASGVQVTIGGVVASNVNWVSATQITLITPANAISGAKDVTITNLDTGAAVRAGGFTYYTTPTIASIAPAYGLGSGGTSITITGTDFATGAQVSIGGVVATNVTWVSATQIIATTPASATSGAKDVTITNMDTGSVVRGDGFTYSVYATGGTITSPTISGIVYRIHTFRNTDSDTLAITTGGNVEYLVVAGGGGGGRADSYAGGGGGGGGVQSGVFSVTAGNKTIAVGSGGATSSGLGNNGNNSSIDNFVVSVGGGGGAGGSTSPVNGRDGGSGGGGSSNGNGGDADYLFPRQGYDGGTGTSGSDTSGGGAGGAGGAGNNGSGSNGGNGGIGIQSSISGIAVYYAGGGGGAGGFLLRSGGIGGSGGSGGGGNGVNSGSGSAGTINTGGGGGGGSGYNPGNGGSGGSGIVIIRYPISQ